MEKITLWYYLLTDGQCVEPKWFLTPELAEAYATKTQEEEGLYGPEDGWIGAIDSYVGSREHGQALENGEAPTQEARQRATVEEYLAWFYCHADFGPAESDVRQGLKHRFMDETGKLLPSGYNYAEDGESLMDDYFDER